MTNRDVRGGGAPQLDPRQRHVLGYIAQMSHELAQMVSASRLAELERMLLQARDEALAQAGADRTAGEAAGHAVAKPLARSR